MTQGNYPGPGQPQYGQPPATPGWNEADQGYGPTAGGPGRGYGAGSTPYVAGTGGGNSIGVVGSLLAVIGAAAIIVAFTAVNWFSDFGTKNHFSDLHKITNTTFGAGVAKAYFGWLGWVLLAVTVILALAANVPSAAAAALRPLGAVVALVSIGLTFWAIKLSSAGTPGYSEYLKHARVGFYLAVAGFLIAGIGALIGPHRSR